MMPPTPWMPKTSRLSSMPSLDFSLMTNHMHRKPAIRPMAIAHGADKAGRRGDADQPGNGPRNPAQQRGMATKHPFAKGPGQRGGGGGNDRVQDCHGGMPVASMFEPALKPNQPIHSRQPPIKVKVRL